MDTNAYEFETLFFACATVQFTSAVFVGGGGGFSACKQTNTPPTTLPACCYLFTQETERIRLGKWIDAVHEKGSCECVCVCVSFSGPTRFSMESNVFIDQQFPWATLCTLICTFTHSHSIRETCPRLNLTMFKRTYRFVSVRPLPAAHLKCTQTVNDANCQRFYFVFAQIHNI